jgi:hypothetical protein
MRISIEVSDPWDLGEQLNWQPISGVITQVLDDGKGGQALIHLDNEINYKDASWRYVVASPRHHGDSVVSVRNGSVLVGLVGVSEARAKSDTALDVGDFRGGLAIVGQLNFLG